MNDNYQPYTLLLLSPPCLYILWKFLRPVSKAKGRLKAAAESDGTKDCILCASMPGLMLVDPSESDPSLLRKHSTHLSFEVTSTAYTYSDIRIFLCPHPQAAKLPRLPLLVFIHGLGGSVAQWHPLLTSLVNLAPCLAVDLPGCGLSGVAPTSWDAYSTPSLLALLEVVIDKYLEDDQEIIFICHSMGCSLGALLTSQSSPVAFKYRQQVKGLITICPPGKSIPDKQVKIAKRLLWLIPDPLFNLWRAWDRRGGTESHSVKRFVGENAEPQLKRLQVRFNNQSRTPVFRRMAYGCLPVLGSSSTVSTLSCGAFLGKDIWAGVKAPVLIVAGRSDPVTKAEDAITIARYLGHSGSPDDHHSKDMFTTSDSAVTQANNVSETRLVILPPPASHALLYSPLTVRPLSSLIQNFLQRFVTEKLSLGWQLQYLTTEGKWDVKNLEKWRAVNPVSTPIAGMFRAMKTLREVDDEHTPCTFVKDWAQDSGTGAGKDGQGPVIAVVDISHDSPVYDPAGLEAGGIVYRKFPTVSKLPPTRDEVRHFINLIDHLRTELEMPAPVQSVDDVANASLGTSNHKAEAPKLIAVHCHYGFNRTGFFVIAYMVEQLGWPLREAIEEFALQRPPGVRHSHFLDELWGRYYDWVDERKSVSSNSG